MLTFNFTKRVKPAVGSQIATPFGLKTLTQADVDSIGITITTETIEVDAANQAAIEGLIPAGAQVHLTPAQLAAGYTKTELLQALEAQA